jgi:hypothetical protein
MIPRTGTTIGVTGRIWTCNVDAIPYSVLSKKVSKSGAETSQTRIIVPVVEPK